MLDKILKGLLITVITGFTVYKIKETVAEREHIRDLNEHYTKLGARMDGTWKGPCDCNICKWKRKEKERILGRRY